MAQALRTDELYAPYEAVAADARCRREELSFRTARGRLVKIVGNTTKVPDHLAEALREISQLDRREAGWDSYRALAVADKAVDGAIELLFDGFRLCDMPRIYQNSFGGVDLAWVRGDRSLEISVGPDQRCEVLYTDGDDDTESLMSISEAKSLISRYCANR